VSRERGWAPPPQRLPVEVIATVALAENMPSGTAYRPSDVLRTRNGKTVEVNNTDAEGRLVMADGLVAAIEDGHDTVIDIATLTGAQMVALGSRVAGFMGTDQVRDALVAAADASGEKAWPMPIPEEMKAALKSNIADMVNVSTDRWGGMLFAGAFLREFVGETPWGHMDIAGPAWNGKGPYGYTHTCGTGYGVRTLVAYLEGLATE
jgi:leucyl aminopeptidase